MENEYLDIIDENNNPTRQKGLRSEIHKNGTWHRTVHVYVYRKKNGVREFLVHLRSAKKDLYPNMWDTMFGGHIKTGVSPEQTAIDELGEETGIVVNKEDLIVGPFIKREKYPDNEYNAVFFYQDTLPDQTLVLQTDEIQKAEWKMEDAILSSLKENPENWVSTYDQFSKVLATLRDIE